MTDFVRYLESKVGIDDRALNPKVRRALQGALPPGPLEVLEVGAGIGTMAERLEGWGLFPAGVRYTAIDLDPANVAAARRPQGFEVEWHCVDLHRFLQEEARRFDLVVAHAFLDLFALPVVMPPLLARVRPGGLLYATLNFDGETIFEPVVDPALEARIQARYHQTMDDRVTDGQPSGDSLCGRHLLTWLEQSGIEVVSLGVSDWDVRPDSPDERYFLHFILDTVAQALGGEEADWVGWRHAQVDSGELRFRARHLDVLARVR